MNNIQTQINALASIQQMGNSSKRVFLGRIGKGGLFRGVALSFYVVILAGCAGDLHKKSTLIDRPHSVKNSSKQTLKNQEKSFFQRQIKQESVDTLRQSNPSKKKNIGSINSPAIVALLVEAKSRARSGRLDAAVATIERALRIEPRNDNLIYELAELRMQQGKPKLAENLAKKANILTLGDANIKRKIWLLIAKARRLQGKHLEATEAEIKAKHY